MALCDFKEEYQICNRDLYVSICINPTPGCGAESRVNYYIDQIIEELKLEVKDYENIYCSYIYETSGLIKVTPFRKLKSEDKASYMESGNIEKSNFEHVFFLGMEQLLEKRNCEKRLYFATDEKLPRVNNIVRKTEYGIEMNERYAKTDAKIFLCKSKLQGVDVLEEYLLSNRSAGVVKKM